MSSVDENEQVIEPEDLDLDDFYEDDVFKVFFQNKKQLFSYATQLEDDNLFKIALVQEDEANLDKFKQKSAE